MADTEQHLWPTESNLPLDTRGYAIDPSSPVQASVDHPSLIGEVQAPGSKANSPSSASAAGIGGTEVRPQAAQGASQASSRQLTPDELMAWANAQEQHFLNQRQDMSTAVDPALLRTGGAQYVQQPKPIGSEVPEWLHSYMHQPSAVDELHAKHSAEWSNMLAMRDATNRNGH
jgi:hypothetical protein